MAVVVTAFVQEKWERTEEWREVGAIAGRLLSYLNETGCQVELAKANLPGQSSAMVQASFARFATELGFADESKGLFERYNRAVRPDYHLRLQQTGILMEVERGKTTINNMDFLDFWKCHLCEHADYLFLMVPQELRQNAAMSPRSEYAYVVKRMSSFFVPRNYTNVRGLHVFGY